MNALVPLLLAAAAGLPSSAEGSVTLRRYALLVGANDGGSARVHLRYAGSDAESMDRVLRELGGLAEADRILLLDPDRARFQESIGTLRALMARDHPAGSETELLLYYSGHSDDRGLLLKEDRVSYEELRDELKTLPADVRIAILDSCSSGEFARRQPKGTEDSTRTKGGQMKPAFLIDSANQVKGHAFLTSSSGDEVAQESDRLGSSFFTHALVSGLRGAADTTGDGRVTLNEAYRFAFDETLARTEHTAGGAQHPSYDIDLVGSGDLVLTDLHDKSAGLSIPKSADGRFFVRDAAGRLVLEMEKRSGHPAEIALEAGSYEITLSRGGHLSQTKLDLTDGTRVTLQPEMFVAFNGEPTIYRGNEAPARFDLPPPAFPAPTSIPDGWSKETASTDLPPESAQLPQPAGDSCTSRGQWVYTAQDGWLFMPYGASCTAPPLLEGADPYMFVYDPAWGWIWIAAPWVFGIGPRPWYGADGYFHFRWYAHRSFGHAWHGHQSGVPSGYHGAASRGISGASIRPIQRPDPHFNSPAGAIHGGSPPHIHHGK